MRFAAPLALTALVAGALGVTLACSSESAKGVATAADGDAAVDTGPRTRTVPAFDDARITSEQGQPNFQNVRAEIDFGAERVAKATLIVDLATTCYPFSKWAANPPPQGQNWPADCDAFDRNFEFTLDDPASPAEPPAIELVRAITPFGGPLHLEIDVTDVVNARPGKHTLRSHIATWSDGAGRVSGSRGGWNVSARFELERGAPPRNVLAAIPLWNGSMTTPELAAPIPFTLPAGTTSARIEYRTTGHGGGSDDACLGPAEEFCRRTHTFTVDGQTLKRWDPVRLDCKNLCTLTPLNDAGTRSYCLENPCGDVGSVRASRANWCPGSVTPPVVLEAPILNAAGAHTAAWSISKVASGGSWRTSAVVFAYGE